MTSAPSSPTRSRIRVDGRRRRNESVAGDRRIVACLADRVEVGRCYRRVSSCLIPDKRTRASLPLLTACCLDFGIRSFCLADVFLPHVFTLLCSLLYHKLSSRVVPSLLAHRATLTSLGLLRGAHESPSGPGVSRRPTSPPAPRAGPPPRPALRRPSPRARARSCRHPLS